MRTVNMLEDSGIMSLELSAGKPAGPTINAFAEKFFRMAMLVIIELTGGSSPGSGMDLLYFDLPDSEFDLRLRRKSLVEAEKARMKKVVLWLLSLGQSPDIHIGGHWAPDPDTPLGIALSLNDPDLALQLLDAGADPAFSYTGFHKALGGKYGRFPDFDLDGKMAAVFKRLADSGLPLDEDHQGESALMLAVWRGSLTAADILIQSGANVLWSSYVTGHSLLSHTITPIKKASVLGYAAASWEEARAMELIKLLTEHAHSTCPSTPLSEFFELDVVMEASSKGHVLVLEYLHQIGYDITGAESNGFTALHVAASAGHY
ncbi:hypothetical protein BDP81DRAFT_76063 [Colletotrichum phormii]|uniref:Uncharacterized protein n=1 Tax=Colletotrichum phormii TaxID=359342 RepID=A0AAI9ZLW4_9PEZI|nr:uncharacterized protein BDP81DRAFT_76063 [Colletotrichum phormii]KAK1625689.1 hypothetical protein BDP81DRAFT_76063 [Colletotrichum phormii]